MKITFKEAYDLLNDADIVMTEGIQVAVGLNDDVIFLSWDDESGSYDYECNFEDNETIVKKGNSLMLNAYEGEIEVDLFSLVPIK